MFRLGNHGIKTIVMAMQTFISSKLACIKEINNCDWEEPWNLYKKITKCGCWDSSPGLHGHNVEFLPLNYSHQMTGFRILYYLTNKQNVISPHILCGPTWNIFLSLSISLVRVALLIYIHAYFYNHMYKFKTFINFKWNFLNTNY